MAHEGSGDHLEQRDQVLQSLRRGWPYTDVPINNLPPLNTLDTPGVAPQPAPLPQATPTPPATSTKPTGRRGWRQRAASPFVIIPFTIVMSLGIGTVIAGWQIQSGIDRRIARFGDPFAQIPFAVRPPKAASAGAAMNLLVFGSDSRIAANDPTQWQAGGRKTDAIMLVHLPADRSAAYIVSIPRDSWVAVPGHGKARLNAAFSLGGPPLAIRTVEQLTGVRIDHMMITDFTGFAVITDLLGGVKITVPQATTLGGGQGTIAAGTHLMDGRTALGYVRSPYTSAARGFDRVKRQQNWIRAIMNKAADSGAATNPQKLLSLLDGIAASLSTDSGFTIGQIRDLTLSMHSAWPGGVTFITAPLSGAGLSPDHTQSIVELDVAKDGTLWTALRTDSVGAWLTTNR
jgi:LCP family protein required for cell wall assembly